MIKAKMAGRNLLGLAAVGIALAGLGGPMTVVPAPAFSQDREAQCLKIVEPALDEAEAAMALGATLDQPGADYPALCGKMKSHETALADHARNLTVCEGLALGGQDQVTLEGLMREFRTKRAAIGESRVAVCEAADLRP
ncbi:hypothetical protein GVN21_01520 [Caulobacter sp. SLTY]|uniref:hypothetical protein n=1 Tax=Caulobacter sp. SLTY TaxID=2683262 RepID=UPI0014124A06|nr:hypothetical protein [Caulobacter sp. SLTY]NBB14030.1 hypothetical protein [Caulobacter sp. SLTY]